MNWRKISEILKRIEHIGATPYARFAEPVVFGVILLLNAGRLFSTRFFPALDAPAHVYNVVLLKEALLASYCLDGPNWILPNVSGHFILLLLSYVLPMEVCAKILNLVLVCGIPLAWRYLMKAYQPASPWGSLLIFPLSWSFFLFLGFFNFLLGIFFFLWVWRCSLYFQKKLTLQMGMSLCVLLTLAWFSHFLMYLFSLMAIGFIYLPNYKKTKYLFGGLLAAIPSLILTSVYILNYPSPGNYSWQPWNIIVEWIINLRFLQIYNLINEAPFTLGYTCIWTFLFLLGIFLRFRKSNFNFKFQSSDWVWIFCIVLFIAIFIIPDGDGNSGGIVTLRIIFVTAIVALLGITTLRLPGWVLAIGGGLLAVFQFNHYAQLTPDINDLNGDANEIYNLGIYLPANSTILVFVNDQNWLTQHASAYLGWNTPVRILKNYEAELQHFPLHWNQNCLEGQHIKNISTSKDACALLSANNSRLVIHYIFIQGSWNSSENNCPIFYSLKQEGKIKLIKQSPKMSLWKVES
jgi:hypothetical protein